MIIFNCLKMFLVALTPREKAERKGKQKACSESTYLESAS
jgi:hypothetical protein